MPQEPKRRHSRERKGKRRAAISLVTHMGTKCTNCGAINLSHRICASCGFYKGKAVLPKKEKTTTPATA